MDTLLMKCIVSKADPSDFIINTVIKWLEDNDILDILIKQSRKYYSKAQLQAYIRANHGYNLINTSMTWDNTEQGFEFWARYSDDYDSFWERNIRPKVRKSFKSIKFYDFG